MGKSRKCKEYKPINILFRLWRNFSQLSKHKNVKHVAFKERYMPRIDCDKTFHSEQSRKNHEIQDHKKDFPYVCHICGKGFTQNTRFKYHQNRCAVIGPRSVEEKCCNECGKSFRILSRFKRHMVSHTKDQAFQCSDCGKAYADKRNLKMHVGKEHSQNITMFVKEKNIQCNLCDQLFQTKTDV